MSGSSIESRPWTGHFRQKRVTLSVVLAVATLLLYVPVAHHEFLNYDDFEYVTENAHVSTGVNLENVRWAFTSFASANWHPVTWLSHMVDCQLFGVNSGAHHLVNVALHAINVLLLFFLLQRATRAVWRSFLVAALFAVHPLNVQTVAWVAERKNLLSTLFCFLAITAYGWYIQRPGWKRYLAVAGMFLLALMSKPMAVTLPVILLLLDYWPLNRYGELSFRQRWVRLSVEKLPLFLMSAGSAVITVAAQRDGGVLMPSFAALPLSLRLENAVISYIASMGKTFWPARLAVFYPHPVWRLARGALLPWDEVLAATVILVGVTALALYFHRVRFLATGYFLFLFTLTPVIGIIQVGGQAMADRYAYLPCIGLFIVLAWGAGEVAKSVPSVVPATVCVCLVLGLTAASRHYLPFWQNGVKLFMQARTVAGSPNVILEKDLADALSSASQVDEALKHYQAACALRPDWGVCHKEIADIRFRQGQIREAADEYQAALRLADSRAMALTCSVASGEAFLDLGEYERAERMLAIALRMDPNNERALLLRQQVLYHAAGQQEVARRAY